ncbi:MAG: acetate--CoA ligase [Acidobacteriia bacterium]|nr:acetate--CoA ligase [Terriglobia bacterium]
MQTVNPVVDRWRREATEDPDVFWGRAADQLPWFRKWDKVFQWDFPTFRWFINAQTNLAYNCLDVQVARGNGGKAAIIYTNERGERRVFTYAQTLFEVKRIAAALRGLGIKRGDTLTIYMPTCPEAIFTMLATVRIGAIHCAVFAGFAASALADRIAASQSKLVFTSDIAYRKGGEVALKGLVDEAVSKVEKGVEHVIVLQRRKEPPAMTPGRDIGWDKFLEGGIGKDSRHEIMESNEPAYILATSGTSAKPKICVHTHGDYAVGITSSARWCFGLKETDVWWATSDIGWVVGHSYIVYAPLLLGCTSVAYEGALDYPGPDTLWRIIEEFKVNAIFTSPTAVRLLMRYGEAVAKQYDFSSLDRVFCAGETLNPSAWEWLQKKVFDNRIPVIDHYWQTETGGPVLGNPYGLGMVPIKPGSASLPLPGKEVAVMSLDGKPCPPGEKGILVVKRPFPGLTARLWGEPERYGRDYWERIKGVYFTGDSAHIDEDGYVWVAGRADEVMNIAGHRIGTIEVESGFLTHPAVAEAGVCGRQDELRGEVISAFVVLKKGHAASDELRKELSQTLRKELGAFAVIGEINFVDGLPKTRSGKIMRRVLKAVVLNQPPGDISTIEEAGSVEDARNAWIHMKQAISDQK